MTVPGVASASLAHPSTMTGLSPRVRALCDWIVAHAAELESSDMVQIQLDCQRAKLVGRWTVHTPPVAVKVE